MEEFIKLNHCGYKNGNNGGLMMFFAEICLFMLLFYIFTSFL